MRTKRKKHEEKIFFYDEFCIISTYTNHLWINLCRNCYSRVSWICRLISFAINCALRRVIAIIEFIYIAMSTILASYFYQKLYLPFSNNEIKISEPFLHFIFVTLIASMKNLKYFGFIFHSLQSIKIFDSFRI